MTKVSRNSQDRSSVSRGAIRSGKPSGESNAGYGWRVFRRKRKNSCDVPKPSPNQEPTKADGNLLSSRSNTSSSRKIRPSIIQDNRPWWVAELTNGNWIYARGTDQEDAIRELVSKHIYDNIKSIEPVHELWFTAEPVEGDHRVFYTRPSRYASYQVPANAGVDLHFENEFAGDPSAFGGARHWPKLVVEVRLPTGCSQQQLDHIRHLWQGWIDQFLTKEGLGL